MARFSERLVVIRVTTRFAGPYRKHQYLHVTSKELKTRGTFTKFLRKRIENWQLGPYFLRLPTGQVFARFDVREGKIDKLYKSSPATGEPYPIWKYFGKPKKIIKKKKK